MTLRSSWGETWRMDESAVGVATLMRTPLWSFGSELEDLILDLELTALLGAVAVDRRIGELQVRVVAVEPEGEPPLGTLLVQQGGEVEVLAGPLEVGHHLGAGEVEAGLDHRVLLLGEGLDEDVAVHAVVVTLQR